MNGVLRASLRPQRALRPNDHATRPNINVGRDDLGCMIGRVWRPTRRSPTTMDEIIVRLLHATQRTFDILKITSLVGCRADKPAAADGHSSHFVESAKCTPWERLFRCLGGKYWTHPQPDKHQLRLPPHLNQCRDSGWPNGPMRDRLHYKPML